MLKKLCILVFFLCTMPSYSSQTCREELVSYQKKYLADYYFPHARIEHLLDLVTNSQNKFKLVEDIYLHYASLSATNTILSMTLEECLLGLLNTTRIIIGKESARKFIARNIVSNKFYKNNNNTINVLEKLSQEELNFLKFNRPTKADFDEVVYSEPGLEKNPDFAPRLLAASQKIMSVYNEGHDLFYKHNINVVHDFILLLKKSPFKNSIQKALDAYTIHPTSRAFNNIKRELRKIYQVLTGKSLPLSLSEIWENLFTTAEKIRQQAWPDNYVKIYLIEQIKLKYDSSELELIEEAAQEINTVLWSGDESIKERIIGVFGTL